MKETKRVNIVFEAQVHRALVRKATIEGRSLSEIVNDAVRSSLAEDPQDLQASEDRESEPTLNFATLVKGLKRRGKL